MADNNNFEKELIVKSSTDNLSLIRNFTKDAALNSGFSKDAIGKIMLAVDEACTNVIKHSYKYSPEGEIEVNVKFNNSKFTISITDHGITRFDPQSVPEPDIKEYHKQKRVGGLGIYLMKNLMDEVKYHSPAKNLNQVILVKYLP